MAVSDALRKLAGVLDEYEEGRVTSVESTGSVDADGAMALTAEIELPLSTTRSDDGRTELALSDATFDADGTLQFALESITPVVSGTDHDATVEPGGVTIDGDGQPTATLVASVPVDRETSTDEVSRGDPAGVDGESNADDTPAASNTDHLAASSNPTPGAPEGDTAGMDGGSGDDSPDGNDSVADGTGSAADGATGRVDARRDRDVPPFRDPELLAEVYESCDTFAEMTDELGMDVTAETVRRYMIEYDIHQPNSYDTGDDAGEEGPGTEADDGRESPEAGAGDGRKSPATEAGDEQDSPVVLPDGIGLPDDVTVDSFIETVKRSNTIYEVKRDIGTDHDDGIDQDDALSMLQELNLLDLVVGRLATEAERDIRREEIVERLREASAAQ